MLEQTDKMIVEEVVRGTIQFTASNALNSIKEILAQQAAPEETLCCL